MKFFVKTLLLIISKLFLYTLHPIRNSLLAYKLKIPEIDAFRIHPQGNRIAAFRGNFALYL